jgi:ABC-type Fe2+-enterobactin transport system substrate-binding protein
VIGDKFIGNLCGNVDGKTATFEGPVSVTTGDVCISSNLLVDYIDSKNESNITVKSTLLPDQDQLYDLGSVDQKWNNIVTQDLTVCGTLTANVLNNATDSNLLIGNIVCVNLELQTDLIVEKTPEAGVTIDGVLVKDGNVTAATVTADKFVGGLCGNVDAQSVVTDTLTLNSDLTVPGNVCATGSIQTDNLESKTTGNVVVTGNVHPDADQLYDMGTLNRKWNRIVTQDITVCGTLTANVMNNTTDSNTIVANVVCVNDQLLVDNILEKTANAGVTIEGVLVQDSNVTTTGTVIADKFIGTVCGNVDAGSVVTDDLTVTNDVTFANVTADTVTADKFIGNVCGNIDAKNIEVDNLTLNSDLTVPGDVCVTGTVQTDEIESKTTGNVIVTGNVHPSVDQLYDMGTLNQKWNRIVTQDITVCGTLTANVMNNTTDSNTIVANVVCVNDQLLVDTILEKTANAGVMIDGVLVQNDSITADMVTADKFTGNLCGNIDAKNIEVDNLTLNNDLTVPGNVCINDQLLVDTILEKTANAGVTIDGVLVQDGNVTADTVVADKFIGTICGNVESQSVVTDDLTVNSDVIFANVTADTVTANKFIGNLCGNVDAKNIEVDNLTLGSDLTVPGDVCVTGTVQTDEIESKTTGNIVVTGNVHPSADQLYDMGTLNQKWNRIVTQDITVCGTLTANVMNNTTDSNTIVANVVCVNDQLLVDTILEKTANAGVMIDGVLVQNDDITAGTVTADKFIGNVCGNIDAKNIETDNLTLNGDLIVPGNVCVTQAVQTDEIESKTTGNVIVTGNVHPSADQLYDMGTLNQKWNRIVTQDITVCGTLTANVMNNTTDSNTIVANVVCVNEQLLVDTILEKNNGAGVMIDGILVQDDDITAGTVTADKFIGNVCGNIDAKNVITENLTLNNDLTVPGNVCVGDQLLVDNILEKTANAGVTIDGVLVQNSNITADTITADKFIGSLCGNVESQSVVTDNLTVTNDVTFANVTGEIITADKFTGNLCGNVEAKNIEVDNLMLTNDLTVPGDVCVTGVQTDEIDSKTTGNVVVTGNLHPSADQLYDMGTLNQKWNRIVTQDITVCGTLTANVMNNTTDSNTIVANVVCVNDQLLVDTILEKTANAGVMIDGVLVQNDDITAGTIIADKFIGNVCGNIDAKNIEVDNLTLNNDLVVPGNVCINDQLLVDNILEKTANAGVTIDGVLVQNSNVTADKFVGDLCGNVNAESVVTDDLTVNSDVTFANVTADVVTADKFIGNVCGNVDAKNVTTDNLILGSDLTVPGDICATGAIQTDEIESKTTGDVVITGNVHPNGDQLYDMGTLTQKWNRIVTQDITVCGTLTANVMNNTTDSNTIVANVVCVNDQLLVDTILEKTANAGVTIDGVLVQNSNVTADKFTGNLCGNVESQNIETDNLTVTNDVTFTNVAAMTITADKFVGNVCGNIDAGSVVTDNLTLNGDLTVPGNVCVDDQLLVDTIIEKTANAGVTIDGVLVQNSNVTADKFTGSLCGNVMEINFTIWVH